MDTKPITKSLLYKFLEIALGFVAVMAVVSMYIYFLSEFVESYLHHTPIPNIGVFIIVGSVGGAIGILVTSAIREHGDAVKESLGGDTYINIVLPSMGVGEEVYIPREESKEECDGECKGGREENILRLHLYLIRVFNG